VVRPDRSLLPGPEEALRYEMAARAELARRRAAPRVVWWRCTFLPDHGPDACSECGITPGTISEEQVDHFRSKEEVGPLADAFGGTESCEACGRLLAVALCVEVPRGSAC